MRERKYIDRLYQEKFKDFEATPNEAVWQAISAKLQEKERKKRVVPIWSRMAGVAAVLAFLLLLGDWFFSSSPRPAVVNEEISPSTLPDTSTPIEDLAEQPQIASKQTDGTGRSESTRQEVVSIHSPALEPRMAGRGEQGIPALSYFEKPNADIKNSEGTRSLFEEVTKQKEKSIALPSFQNKFEISTHAAPIYYGNFGKGSLIDPKLNGSHSQGEITYSYGINVAYRISEKIKIRSGISKVSMSYNTDGIAYHAILGPVPVGNISITSRSEEPPKVTTAADRSGRGIANPTRANIGALTEGMLNQKMGYIEVPVELEFNLIDKRFELNLIGGASTLFLDENQVSMNSEKVRAIGEANNLNEVSFSTNLGFGIDYNLTDRFQLNVEPILKYQLGTFNSATSTGRPYYFGIYSGFSYKF